MTLEVTINGKNYEAEKGEYILEVCRRNRILVPTLCHHESLSGLGACRLCVVEVNEGSGNKVVVSCVYPLSKNCEVFTESAMIKGIRKTILSMLRARAPEGDRLASLCRMYGVEEDRRFRIPRLRKGPAAKRRLSSACVLCGLCAQACAALGSGAIATAGRGVAKKIATPYDKPSADCIGCGSCAEVCPTRAIKCRETKRKRYIWGRKFELMECASCGTSFATSEEYALAQKKADTMPYDDLPLCEACRRKKSADVFAAAFGERTWFFT